MNSSNTNVGQNLKYLVSKFLVLVKESPCCSTAKTLDAYGPELAGKHIKTLIKVLKLDPNYTKNDLNLSDRTIYLFIRKSIRMTGFDMGKLHRYNIPR
jgi:hypothetical protein